MVLMSLLETYTDKGKGVLYLLFRLVFGGLFLMHGLTKFGIPSGTATDLASMMGVAGIVEILVGVTLVLGLFTRLTALFGIVQMLVAYFMVHFPQGLSPLANGGELALLYFAAFLVVLVYGNGEFSVESAVMKKETF